jgi:hypothetical protein
MLVQMLESKHFRTAAIQQDYKPVQYSSQPQNLMLFYLRLYVFPIISSPTQFQIIFPIMQAPFTFSSEIYAGDAISVSV